MLTLVVLALVYIPMLVEVRRAAANERAQLARGGVEAAGDVYHAMRIAYPAAFLVMILEGALRGSTSQALPAIGVAVFTAAKALKWSAILSLGRFWTFRVITVPGAALVRSGPYRVLRHPNYVAVIGEIVGTALMSGALITGPLVTFGFGLLIVKRILVEERALDR